MKCLEAYYKMHPINHLSREYLGQCGGFFVCLFVSYHFPFPISKQALELQAKSEILDFHGSVAQVQQSNQESPLKKYICKSNVEHI